MPAFVDPKNPKPGIPGTLPLQDLAKSVSVASIPTRYFMFSYLAQNRFGCVTIAFQGFPSWTFLVKQISALMGKPLMPADVSVISFSEFKSKADFDAFLAHI